MWTIYFAFFALLVGGGMTFVSIAPAEFVYAKACFVTAGIMAMVGLFLWLTRPEWEAVNYRSLIAFLAYGLVGVTIVAAWQWVADRENGALAEKQRQINFIVPLKEYLRCGEQHLRDLKGSPAPTFDASREVAMKWQGEIVQFLKLHCPDAPMEPTHFIYQAKEDGLFPFSPVLGERYRESYPQIYNTELLRVVGFYEVRLEYLRERLKDRADELASCK